MDGTVAPLLALPRVLEAVPRSPVMLDTGVRRGPDVLKAIAPGACFVFVGRPFGYAAAVAGEAGVRHGLKLPGEEVLRNMGMLGVLSISDVTRECLFEFEDLRDHARFVPDTLPRSQRWLSFA